MKIIYALTVSLLIATGAQAQTESVSVWSVASYQNTETNESLQQSSEFRLTPNQQVIWTQQGGAKVYTFELEQTAGQWNDLQAAGTITLTVSRASLTGTLLFKRDAGGVTITMDFEQEGHNVMPYVFQVTTVNTL